MAKGDSDSYRRAALFVDFENVYIGLRNSSPEAAAAFATDPGRWVRWMEQDLGPFRVDDDEVPRVLLRRICYLEPSHSGKFRSYFTRAGFRVVDCPSLTSMGKNSADIHMVLDILDTLTHPTRFDDFVVLSTDADFTPVFMRLREHDRTSAMLVSGPTAAALQSVCDFAIPDIMFIEEALGLSPSQTGRDHVRTPVPQPRTTPAVVVDSDSVRIRLETAVRQLVAQASTPVDLASAAHHVRKVVGREATINWAGAGGFKQFVAAIQSDTLVLEPRHPGWLFDPARHELVQPAGVPEIAERVNRVVGAPLIGTDAYQALFQSIADEGRADPALPQAQAEEVIREACGRRGQAATRSAIHFVLIGLKYSGVDWRDARHDAASLASEFAGNVLRLTVNVRMELSEMERAAVRAWIQGEH
ncbi:NYN domain-containing protein [Micromonospora yangpuensis]|uniref:NYN domain-containing protein n=1 Tax=Micromonospora yangpuensis TaxID=683228 RepID=A0A1C6U3Z3_9ACTN|nr:NYN domain-containing protein [Micromonospora yangpuensis]GGL93125.1 NYN domain-containing protein [Micromonospora yangpuensis]SCL48724.1 NYN domain-containing protein [Micromonospora yangpuensis]